jgi:antitoxin (DNA-binding transcriptional repressor) of toxin-antitoxin stability system
MAPTFTIGEAKTQLSKLVALAEKGEPVELRRDRTPVVRLVPVPHGGSLRKPGALAGRIKLADDFDAWPPDVERALGLRD